MNRTALAQSSIEIHCLGEITTINQVAANSCVCNLLHKKIDNDIDSNNGAAEATANATTEANTEATANATTEANAEATANATTKANAEATANATTKANTEATSRATYKGTCKDPSKAVAEQSCQATTRTGSSFRFCVVGQNHEGQGCSRNAAMLQGVPTPSVFGSSSRCSQDDQHEARIYESRHHRVGSRSCRVPSYDA